MCSSPTRDLVVMKSAATERRLLPSSHVATPVWTPSPRSGAASRWRRAAIHRGSSAAPTPTGLGSTANVGPRPAHHGIHQVCAGWTGFWQRFRQCRRRPVPPRLVCRTGSRPSIRSHEVGRVADAQRPPVVTRRTSRRHPESSTPLQRHGRPLNAYLPEGFPMSAPAPERRLLPLYTRSHPGGRAGTTCHFRCGNACAMPVPKTSDNDYFGDVVAAGASRCAVLKGTGALTALTALTGLTMASGSAPAAARPRPRSPLGFSPISRPSPKRRTSWPTRRLRLEADHLVG